MENEKCTESVWSTGLKIALFVFAVIGFFTVLSFGNSLVQEYSLSGSSSIIKNITIMDISYADQNNGYVTGIKDQDGDWYQMTEMFSVYRTDPAYIGHNYTISYFCDPLSNNDRTKISLVDLAPDKYKCVIANGKCI